MIGAYITLIAKMEGESLKSIAEYLNINYKTFVGKIKRDSITALELLEIASLLQIDSVNGILSVTNLLSNSESEKCESKFEIYDMVLSFIGKPKQIIMSYGKIKCSPIALGRTKASPIAPSRTKASAVTGNRIQASAVTGFSVNRNNTGATGGSVNVGATGGSVNVGATGAGINRKEQLSIQDKIIGQINLLRDIYRLLNEKTEDIVQSLLDLYSKDELIDILLDYGIRINYVDNNSVYVTFKNRNYNIEKDKLFEELIKEFIKISR